MCAHHNIQSDQENRVRLRFVSGMDKIVPLKLLSGLKMWNLSYVTEAWLSFGHARNVPLFGNHIREKWSSEGPGGLDPKCERNHLTELEYSQLDCFSNAIPSISVN